MTLARYIRPRWAIHGDRPVIVDAEVLAAAVVEDCLPVERRPPDEWLIHAAERRAGCHGEGEALLVARADAEEPRTAERYAGALPW